MISILSALLIYGVLSAEPGSIAPQSQPLTKKPSFLPIDVTAKIVWYLQCDDTALAHFSETNRAHYVLARPVLIIREQLYFHSIERSLIEIVEKSGAKRIEVPEFSARREIEHYLDGFEGHIDWLMEFLKSTNQDDAHIMEHIDEFQTKLARCGKAYPRSVPLHRRLQRHQLTDAQRELFDAFIVMKDKAMEMIEEERRTDASPMMAMKCAHSKLLVEQIGVRMWYPTLQGMQWTGRRDLSPKAWRDDIASVQDRTFDFTQLPAGQRWTAPLMHYLHDFVVRTSEQRLALDKLFQPKSDGVDSSASDEF